nr:hypothetical protein Iba_chr02cCG8840 [Ipomoea batatas]
MTGCSNIRMGLISLLLHPLINHPRSAGPLGPNLVTHPRNSISCERLHTWILGLNQHDPLSSAENPSKVGTQIQHRSSWVILVLEKVPDHHTHVKLDMLDHAVKTEQECRGAAVGAPVYRGAIRQFFPKLLDVRHISDSVVPLFLCALLDRAEILSYLQMPPRQRKKLVAQRLAPVEQPPATPLHDPKNFDRFQFFSQRRVFQPYVLSLDVADEFGIRAEVEDMVALPEWRYLLMDFAEDTYKSVLVEVMTTMKLPKFDGLTSSPCVQFHVGHSMFRFSADDLSDLMNFGQITQTKHINKVRGEEDEDTELQRASNHKVMEANDPARQVSLDFVLAIASGFDFSFPPMRRSQTRMLPSDDADATKYGYSSSLSENTRMPLTRAECASSMLFVHDKNYELSYMDFRAYATL